MFPGFGPSVSTVAVEPPVNGGVPDVQPSVATPDDRKGELLEKTLDALVPITRAWGLLAAIVLGGVGVDLAFHKHQIGYYLTGGSAFLLTAEVTWVATLFLQICVRNESRIWRCWSAITWFSEWKKSIIYSLMGAVPLIWPHKFWLSYVAGGAILLLAFLHFLLTFRGNRRKKKRKHGLLHNDVDSFESSKFDEVTDCIDDGLPEPIPGSSHSISDSLQDTILEV